MNDQPPLEIKRLITLPLTDFLDYLWRSNDYSIVSQALGESIKALDPTEIFCHVGREVRLHKTIPSGNLVIWRKAQWELDILNYERQKRESEVRVAEHEKHKMLFNKVAKGIENYIGPGSQDMAVSMTHRLLSNKEKLLEKIRAFIPDTDITEEDLK